MNSSYEKNRFRNKYIFVTGIFFFIIFLLGYIKLDQVFTIVILTIFLVFALLVYSLFSYYLKKTYTKLEDIANIMNLVNEGKEPPSEEFQEGLIGILYTSFYKMVEGLKESRNRELEEKIFLRDIISDISHQLKTPLASLMVFMDLLLEDKVKDPKKQKEILKEAENQLNRMEWMVLSMLKLARIEAGAIQFDIKKTKLDTVLFQAIEGIQYLVKKRNQKIILSCDEDVSLSCDGEWLTEAIINLLKNASDYSKEGKKISLEVESTNIYTRIYVKDEGCGIAQKDISNVFKRFYRVNQEVNPNSVGIGLSLTKSIIEGMDGSIHVQSEEGKYTWFVITFVK